MESPTGFLQLLDKYLTQTITPEELQAFFAMVDSKKYVHELESAVGGALADGCFDVAEDTALREQLFERILQQRGTPVRRIPAYHRWGWAAAVVILLGGAVYFYATTNNKNNELTQQQNTNGIMPGTNKAMLTLSDGTVITLDSMANGAIAQEGNASVTKLTNGEIRYDVKGLASGKPMMNTMSTPRGGQYNLVLPDGSKVWLNAASSITYPAAFTGNERSIKVNGEVYLEVAKDKNRPFLVDIGNSFTIEVLGTSFNINAYTNEENIKTTLIDGSIRVRNGQVSGQGLILQPGQQALLAGNTEEVRIQAADTEEVLAWKNGFINFDSGSFAEIMRQIERWYDIDVKLEGPMSSFSIGGRMDRGVQLNDLMEFMTNFGIHSRLEGKTLILTVQKQQDKN